MRYTVMSCLVLILVACGSGTLTVAEYADEAEELVAEMETQFASLDRAWESQAPSVDGARRYWDGRLAIRDDFLEGVEALEPPDEIADMHAAALDVFSRITAADQALAERVATFETFTDHWQWVGTPEGQAADAVLEEVFALCRASQEEFDATREPGVTIISDSPWISPEQRQAVRVAFGCPQ